MKINEMRQYLIEQARIHPATQAQDIIKQCFQTAFGAEHLICDAHAAERYLHEEFETVDENAVQPVFEQIAPNTCRVNLAAWKAAKLPHEWLFRLFFNSACETARGNPVMQKTNFDVVFSAALDAAKAGELPVSYEHLAQVGEEYFAQGIRPVHHTQVYRDAEHPAYRVVSGSHARLLPVFSAIAPQLSDGAVLCIAIDGRAASGKSTMAAQFAAITGAGVVHMDDFFLPPALRTPQRLAEPGGNVDYERFTVQVLPKLGDFSAFTYPRFDCDQMRVDGVREVVESSLRVVEGSYSHHPYFGNYCALRVFSDLDPETQADRICRRDGAEMAEIFRTRWIPMEEKYFTAFSIRERANLQV